MSTDDIIIHTCTIQYTHTLQTGLSRTSVNIINY